MKKLFILLALMASSHFASAQVLISDFSSIGTQAFSPFNASWYNGSNQFTQGSGFTSITSVSGGNPQGDGSFDAVIAGSTPLNLTGFNTLSLTARVDSGNTDISLGINLYDSSFTPIGSAIFSTSSFTSSISTVNASIALTGNITDATYWTLSGDNIASDNVRMSFDNLSIGAVPEPSSVALMSVGLAALGFFFYRRSSKAVLS